MKMNKLTLVALMGVFAFSPSLVQAQKGKAFYKTPYKSRNSGSFDKRTGLLSLGYGFPNRATGDYYFWGGSNRIGFGPAYVKYEHGVADEIGIGGYMAVAASRYKYNSNYVDKALAISGGVMGFYHFNKLIPVSKLDVYAGAGIGVRQYTYSYDDDFFGNRDNRTNFSVRPVVKVGARYYVAKSFGFYGEAGYDYMSDVNLGITFRF